MNNANDKTKINIFKSVFKLTIPYVITTTSAAIIVKLCGGGLPFVKDDIVKYKYYDIKGCSNGIIDVSENYKNRMDIDDNSEYKITTYSIWNKSDDKYEREVTTYYFDTLDNKYMYDAFFVCDENFFNSLCKDKDIEIEASNTIPKNYTRTICEGEIAFLDYEDTLIKEESNVRNYTVTFSELLVSFLTGYAISQVIKNNKKEDVKEKKLILNDLDVKND